MIESIKNSYEDKISRISKGQFLSILVVVTLLFISGGGLFTTLFAKQQLGHVWSIYTGDHRQMAETYAKTSHYPIFLSNNVEYAINNAAYELGTNGSDREWNKSNIPAEEQLLSDFNESIVAHNEYGIRSQNYYAGCSVPNIGYFSVDEMYGYTDGHIFGYNMDSNIIKCGKGGFESKAIDKMENFFFSDRPAYDRQENIDHNYIPTYKFAVEMTEELRDSFNPPIYDTANETTGQCDPDSENREEAKDEAYNTAKNDARDKIQGKVSDAASNSDKPGYLEVLSTEWASNYVPGSPANTYDVECDLTHQHLNSTCEQDNCEGGHTHSGSYRGAGPDCSYEPFYSDATTCVSHTHEHEQAPDTLVKKKYEYNVSLATYYAEINITDVDNSVPTHKGMSTNIPFDYKYTHPIGD